VIGLVVALLLCFLRRKKQGDTHRLFTTTIFYVVLNTKLIGVLFFYVSKINSASTESTVKPQNETSFSQHAPAGDTYMQSSLQLDENRRYTYKELKMITNNFERILGRGGFGKVYDGFLEDGTQVAIKLRSDSSNQGVKEFLAEVGFREMRGSCF
jgi:hypothetical protein